MLHAGRKIRQQTVEGEGCVSQCVLLHLIDVVVIVDGIAFVVIVAVTVVVVAAAAAFTIISLSLRWMGGGSLDGRRLGSFVFFFVDIADVVNVGVVLTGRRHGDLVLLW